MHVAICIRVLDEELSELGIITCYGYPLAAMCSYQHAHMQVCVKHENTLYSVMCINLPFELH